MDTRIPMNVQPLDFAGSMTNGLQAGMMQRQAQQQNSLAQLYQTQGPQIMAGEQGAMNSLARLDAPAAMGIQGQRLGMQAQQFNMDQARQQAAQQAKAEVDRMSAAEAAAASAKLQSIWQGALVAPDEQSYNAALSQNGINPAQYPFATRHQTAAMIMGAKDALDIQAKMTEMNAPPPAPDPLKDMPSGYAANDPANPAAGMHIIPGYEKPGPQNVVNLGGGSDKQVFDLLATKNEAAIAAVRGLSGIAEAKAALPNAITGAGADQRLVLTKVAGLFGADTSRVVDTETFRSAIAPQVAAMLKATVGTAQISNTDREFAEKAAGGSIALDGSSIARLLDIMEKSSRAQIDQYNTMLESVYPPGGGFDRERALFSIPAVAAPAAPPPPPPSGTVGPTATTGAGGMDFATMDSAALAQVDITTLNEQQLVDFMAKMKATYK